MLRKALTIVSLLGLVLSLGLWSMSYWRLNFRTAGHAVGIMDGCLVVDSNPRTVFLDSTKRWGGFHQFRTMWEPAYRYYGYPMDEWILRIPLWLPTALFGVLLMSGRLLGFQHRRSRKKAGLCVNCAYDLRGSEECCPECGSEFETT